MGTQVRLNAELFAAISTIIESILVNERVITKDSDLIKDLKMDSIYMIEFVMALEGQYNFKMTAEQLARIFTVGDVVALIMEIQGKSSGQTDQ